VALVRTEVSENASPLHQREFHSMALDARNITYGREYVVVFIYATRTFSDDAFSKVIRINDENFTDTSRLEQSPRNLRYVVQYMVPILQKDGEWRLLRCYAVWLL
jgi:hypothetical protein